MNENQNTTTDEQLVVMHKKARERKKRKFMITLIVIVVVVLFVVTLGVTLLRKKVTDQFGAPGSGEVESAEVTVGSIKTTVSGSGTLAAEDVESLDILSTIEIVDYYVEEGDSVEEGDLIATVTNASLLTAMSEKQDELDSIDEELADASGDEVSSKITSSVKGRVKKIYVSKGDDIATAMYKNGSLMLLSLDGYMAVDVSSDTLSAGNTVQVTLSSGSKIKGTVEKQTNGVATILVTDNGTKYGDTVTVSDSDGNEIGESTLYIHSQLAITGYAGTVSSIAVSENESVSAGETLVKLTDTETSANYDTLLKERKEVEEQLNDLIKIYKEGGVCATIDGVVESLGDLTSGTEGTETVSMQTENSDYVTVATISPNTSMSITISVDETDILSLEKDQEAIVTIDSIGTDTYTGTGTVTEVGTTASSSSGVTTYSAVVSIEKTEQMLSGMSASVVITIEGTDDALLIPVDALHQTSSTAYVYTEYNEESGEFSGMKEVTIGISNSTYVEIKEGLNEGDTVYYTASEEDSSSMPGNTDMGNMEGFDSDNMPGGGQMPSGDNLSGGGQMPGGRGGSAGE